MTIRSQKKKKGENYRYGKKKQNICNTRVSYSSQVVCCSTLPAYEMYVYMFLFTHLSIQIHSYISSFFHVRDEITYNISTYCITRNVLTALHKLNCSICWIQNSLRSFHLLQLFASSRSHQETGVRDAFTMFSECVFITDTLITFDFCAITAELIADISFQIKPFITNIIVWKCSAQ